jgi:hypothetical protein
MIFPVSYCKTFCYEQTDTGSERDLDRRLFICGRERHCKELFEIDAQQCTSPIKSCGTVSYSTTC